MGISHEYHSAPRRRTGGGISGKLRLAGVIVAILLVAYAVTAILEKGTAAEDSTPQTSAGGIAQNILAPLPMQGETDSGSESAAGDSGTAQAVQLVEQAHGVRSAGYGAQDGVAGGDQLPRQKQTACKITHRSSQALFWG